MGFYGTCLFFFMVTVVKQRSHCLLDILFGSELSDGY